MQNHESHLIKSVDYHRGYDGEGDYREPGVEMVFFMEEVMGLWQQYRHGVEVLCRDLIFLLHRIWYVLVR